jgi:hypothetical protein
VVTAKGNVELGVCGTMLDHVATLLKRARRGTFLLLVDRGFRNRDWARKCRSPGWDYSFVLPITRPSPLPGGVFAAADCWGIKPGGRRYLPNVSRC